MTAEQKQFILERLGKMPQHEIAKRAGVTDVAISQLKRQIAREQMAASVPYDPRRALKRAGGRRKYG